jgi:hypothetical protein
MLRKLFKVCGGSFAEGLNCRKEEQAEMGDLLLQP